MRDIKRRIEKLEHGNTNGINIAESIYHTRHQVKKVAAMTDSALRNLADGDTATVDLRRTALIRLLSESEGQERERHRTALERLEKAEIQHLLENHQGSGGRFFERITRARLRARTR